MPRYKITIEYDGTPFSGWQIQANGSTVQGELSRAIHALTGEQVFPTGAGRTDSGVHARGQVAHFDLIRTFRPEVIRDALTFHLRPAPIAIISCALVNDDFNARFSAKARHYLYAICNRRAPLILERNRAWHIGKYLDVEAMQEGAHFLLGRHDFTTFRSSQCQAKSAVRTLERLEIVKEGDTILIEVSARSFLHHQVRSMAGSLKLVGEGKWNPGDLRVALDKRDRAACGPVAPACGLYFMKVDY